jgi:hypothetical protein
LWPFVNERHRNFAENRLDRKTESGLSMPRVMAIHSLRQKTLSTPLTASGKSGAAAFGLHASAKTMLALASSFRSLISAFHKTEKFARRELKAVTLGWSRGLSMYQGLDLIRITGCKRLQFLE